MAKEATHYGVQGPWTTLQINFVEAYFQTGFHQAKAAELAGSKAANKAQAGHELAKVPHIKRAIEKERSKRLGHLEGETHFELLQRLRIQALADRSGIYNENWDVKPLSKWTDDQKLLLESVSYQTNADGHTIATPKLISRERSQQMLAKAIGMLRERLEVSTNGMEAEIKRIKEDTTAKGRQIRELLSVKMREHKKTKEDDTSGDS